MKQSLPTEADGRLTADKFSVFYGIQTFITVHKSSTGHILSIMNTVCTLTPYLFNVLLNSILPSAHIILQVVFVANKRTSRLLPSDSAPVLQCGCGPSSDFLGKILGVDTPLFLCNTQFYSPLSLLLDRVS
jgi:hypothetical protein